MPAPAPGAAFKSAAATGKIRLQAQAAPGLSGPAREAARR
jgi:hypothetical protein